MNRREKQVVKAAAVTATFNAPEFGCEGYIGARFWLNVTAGTCTPKLQIKNPTSGVWIDFPLAAFATGVVGTDQYLTVYPGLTAAANVVVPNVLSGGLRFAVAYGSGPLSCTVTAQFLG